MGVLGCYLERPARPIHRASEVKLLDVSRIVLAVLLVTLCSIGSAIAQQFPAKAIRVINPAAPGGNSDIFFRLLAPKMGEILGQQLVIDYRPGAPWRAR